MKWCVIADFFASDDAVWLDDFIKNPALEFRKVAPTTEAGSWHTARSMSTGLSKWLRHFTHARAAFAEKPDGIITCFPQLAMSVGLIKRLQFRKTPVVAHNFNIGKLTPGVRQKIAQASAAAIDHFIVHSPSEVAPYAAYMGVPEDRVHFIPLQRPDFGIPRKEDAENPYVLAMGSAHRDYATMIEALKPLAPRTIIVTREDIIAELPKHPWIEYRHGLSFEDCLHLMARARLSVTPVSNMKTASGQVTFVNAMRMGVPVVATRCPGTDGYVEDGETGLLTKPFDVTDMREKITRLWQDDAMRRKLAERSKTVAAETFSDEAAAKRLEEILLTYV